MALGVGGDHTSVTRPENTPVKLVVLDFSGEGSESPVVVELGSGNVVAFQGVERDHPFVLAGGEVSNEGLEITRCRNGSNDGSVIRYPSYQEVFFAIIIDGFDGGVSLSASQHSWEAASITVSLSFNANQQGPLSEQDNEEIHLRIYITILKVLLY